MVHIPQKGFGEIRYLHFTLWPQMRNPYILGLSSYLNILAGSGLDSAFQNESGEHFLQKLQLMFSQNGICSAFLQKIPGIPHLDNLDNFFGTMSSIYIHFTNRKTSTFIMYGDTLTLVWFTFLIFFRDPQNKENASFRKVWIMTSQTDFILTGIQKGFDLHLFDGAISFQIQSKEPLGFRTFLQTLKPYGRHRDGFIKDFWEQAFDCVFPNSGLLTMDNEKCTGEENLDHLPESLFEMQMTGHSYSIYNGVYAVAHSLHGLLSKSSNEKKIFTGKRVESLELQPFKVTFSQQIGFPFTWKENLYFR